MEFVGERNYNEMIAAKMINSRANNFWEKFLIVWVVNSNVRNRKKEINNALFCNKKSTKTRESGKQTKIVVSYLRVEKVGSKLSQTIVPYIPIFRYPISCISARGIFIWATRETSGDLSLSLLFSPFHSITTLKLEL